MNKLFASKNLFKVKAKVIHYFKILNINGLRIFSKIASPTIFLLTERLIKRNINNTFEIDILIIRFGFHAYSSALPSSEFHHLDKSLESTKLATFETITYEGLGTSPLNVYRLAKAIVKLRPKTVLLSSWSPKNIKQPSTMSLSLIKRLLPIKLVAIWWDSCHKGFESSISPVFNLFDVHVIVDNPSLKFLSFTQEEMKKIIVAWAPQDPELFNSNESSKDNDVIFIGQTGSYRSTRKLFLNYLRQNGVPVSIFTHNRSKQFSHQEYAKKIRDSKIVINFSQSVDCKQLKSRVFETLLSGSLLLEEENTQITKYFEPEIDFVPFSTKEELLKKIQYYLNNPTELSKVSESGHTKARKSYSPYIFWKKVINSLN